MIDSQKFAQDIAVALGLDPKATQSIDLHIKAGELVTCDISQIVTSEGIGTAIAKNGYILTPIHRPPADAGAGWRFVEPDERIEKGDEYFSRDGKWTVTNVGGYIVSPRTPKGEGYAYRRKVIPVAGDGFRLLGEDEVIKDGDEAFVSGVWMRTKVGDEGRTPKGEGYTYRRRKIEWREVAVGEVVRPGDEVYVNSVWLLSSMGDWGMPVRVCDRFRRRDENCVEVGGGWTELKDGEFVVGGDEVFLPAVGDRPCRWVCAANWVHTRGGIYRRVEVGDGWRRLGQDEIIQWGDEYHAGDVAGWLPTTHRFGDARTPKSEGRCYRRAGPIAGKGWRLLAKDEITETGDEVWISVGWIPLLPTGDPAGDRYTFRRRVTDDIDRLKAELAPERKKCELLEDEVAGRRNANEQMRANLPTLDEEISIKWLADYCYLMSPGLKQARDHIDTCRRLVKRLSLRSESPRQGEK